MVLREKHKASKAKKSEIQKKVSKLKKKINKNQKKLLKAEKKLEELNSKIKGFKKSLRQEAKKSKKKEVPKKKAAIKKSKAVVKVPTKAVTKIKKTSKAIAKTPTKAVRKTVQKKKELVPVKESKQDLQVIDGIGPKIEKVLNEAGIDSYLKLAQCSNETIDSIMQKSFTNWKAFNTFTWPEQAMLANAGKMDVLEAFIEKLKTP